MTDVTNGHGDAPGPIRAFVIGRDRKGKPIGDAVSDVQRLLAESDATVTDVAVVKHKRDIRRLTRKASRDGCDVVIAVGGDGTVLQVATALAETQVALAIVPTGTGNLLAGNLGIPHEPADAVHTALTGRRRRIDVGRLTVDRKRRAFTVACGAGFDADVMDRTDSKEKGRWGRFAYLANAIREGGNIHNVSHEITLDGVRSTTEAAQVLIANFGRVPPGLKVRGVRADDGLLDVFIVRASGPLPALLAGWEALRTTGNGGTDGGRVFRARARTVRVETSPKRRVETDGSVVGRTPFTASIQPKALTVMVPRR
ncbi:MAG TPA: diacylglycerol kinase family protein [Candidatus Limnocylindrales bacterium]